MQEQELKSKLSEIKDRLSDLRESLDYDQLLAQKEEIDEQMAQPNFWNDSEEAQKVAKRGSNLKGKIKQFDQLEEEYQDLSLLLELAVEEDNQEVIDEVDFRIGPLAKGLEQLELQTLLSGKYDDSDALLAINPGAGGTESQDWAEMLLRMYTRWAEQHGYQVNTLEFMAGEEAGIKSVTLQISGPYAYGYLKSEKGVHRLVRISPFDSSGRRHTSFASVDVMPEIDDDIEVDIDKNDLKIETYRASGAGGQHVNTTDSAVRITHQPTGIVVQCQNQRSQHKNREGALKILKAKLFDYLQEKQADKIDELRGEYKEIAWGSQIRSYVFHPYQMIKDHRTAVETGKSEQVLDGDLDLFIEAYLKEE
ncbi:peptide chain release factor 2 [Natroniella acetigena]|uniref:peptide chain release factor 2 n=1 Tax=Natroniella acetigena TaxID=52004 RepID=UPI00200B8170|nr:peptide chain release factor 2 [Natroniella acetigena]MCK8828115.1 peptide chain release factor 2 [Natroniella acetigena]